MRPKLDRTVSCGRRRALQAGAVSLLGLGAPRMSRRSDAAPVGSAPRAKSIVIVFLTGAASHHDTFDMKPDTAAEIRGQFQPISTSVPGLQICEHLPELARRADQYTLIRTLSHRDNNHLMSTHHVLTGHLQPGGFFDKVASRDDWPCYSSALQFLLPRGGGMPSGVNLPTFLMEGPLTWPGQHAGFLGTKYDPWQIVGDPQQPDFKVDSLTLAPGVDATRLDHRRALLERFNAQRAGLADAPPTRRMADDQKSAFSILSASRLAEAFELDHEPDTVRDRYGRHTTGQSLLLARRLIEVGVPIVQTNIGRVQTWDNHSNIFPTLKDRLLPPLDQGVSALLDDLKESGRLDETLVMMLGEFGRTPKLNGNAGRDHWGPCFFAVFAGAGVRGGQVIGQSDEIGAYPIDIAFAPDDVGATVYASLGIDPNSVVRDRIGRPVHLNTGKVISQLTTG